MSSLAQEIRALAERLEELDQSTAQGSMPTDADSDPSASDFKGGEINPSDYNKIGISAGDNMDLSFLAPGLRGTVEEVTPFGAIVHIEGKDAPPIVFGQDALAWFQSKQSKNTD